MLGSVIVCQSALSPILGVTGIYVDQADTSPGSVAYYTSIYSHIKTANSLLTVTLSPGTATPEAYLACADVLIIFENEGTMWSSYTPDAYVAKCGCLLSLSRYWCCSYAASRFGAILHYAAGTSLAQVNVSIFTIQ